MVKTETRETQYQIQFDTLKQQGLVQLGPTTSHLWRSDPKHLVFYLARYKFVAKMLADCSTVLEVGCGDGFGSGLLLQNKCHVTCVDFDPLFVQEAAERNGKELNRSFLVADLTRESMKKKFSAAYLLDVIEHIEPSLEDVFIQNVADSVTDDAPIIFGTPSLESQQYASEWSKAGHVNCKKAGDWKTLLSRFFKNVYVFSMNDEVIHTGFFPMAHYLMIVCSGKK